MKKLFTFLFASLLAVCVYANSELNLAEINLDVNKLNLNLPQDDYPLSAKSHKNNTHYVTVNLTLVDLNHANFAIPVGERYWGDAWNKTSHDYETEEELEEAANKFAEDFEAKEKAVFLRNIKSYKSSVQTTCKMVRISANWLIGASYCLPIYVRENPQINSKDKDEVAFRSFIYTEKEFDEMYFVDNLRIEGLSLDAVTQMFISEDLMLVHLSNAQIDKLNAFRQSPQANIFAPNDTKALNFINSVYLEGKEIADFTINGFNLTYKKSKKSSGTPVFFADEKYQEFLLGFNSAEYEDYTRGITNKFFPESGKEYKLFTKQMGEFIENTISTATPDEWNKVKRKIVDEKYFNK